MGYRLKIERLCNFRSQRLLSVVGIMTILVILSQFFLFPYENYILFLSHTHIGMAFVTVSNTTFSTESMLANADIVSGEVNDTSDSGSDEEVFYGDRDEGNRGYKFSLDHGGQTGALLKKERQLPSELTSGRGLTSDKLAKIRELNRTENSHLQDGLEIGLELTEQLKKSKANPTQGLALNASASLEKGKLRSVVGVVSARPLTTRSEFVTEASDTSVSYTEVNGSLVNKNKKDLKMQLSDEGNGLEQTASLSSNHSSVTVGKSLLRKSNRRPTSISDMNTLLRHGFPSANLMRPRWFSARDKELQDVRHQIENAPVIRNAPRLYASLFRNYSMFIRSYELMERVLRVYIYKEGQKPIFHQPHLRGIYASEGWFMKMMEGNRHFAVPDPRKSHLFYLPFSSLKLRKVLPQQNFRGHEDLGNHLKNYVNVIARKYPFWNRTKGADHFLVACHDWAPQHTRQTMGSSIRALCNSNIARGFQIGKDVSLPVTYIRSAQNPIEDLGGNLPSERPILAFFAGSMHGYLRPILLEYWNHKESDMMILGPMPRDIEGKARYREFMKSSKYCICARGYEVHTPRVMESIHYECVPVIISDNYVPPLFEIFEWESFSVFVLEKDIPNLRNILLAIPEKKYMEMQNRLKMVQQHFLWHKTPVKYDLFHMILHSIWYNRVFQVNSK